MAPNQQYDIDSLLHTIGRYLDNIKPAIDLIKLGLSKDAERDYTRFIHVITGVPSVLTKAHIVLANCSKVEKELEAREGILRGREHNLEKREDRLKLQENGCSKDLPVVVDKVVFGQEDATASTKFGAAVDDWQRPPDDGFVSDTTTPASLRKGSIVVTPFTAINATPAPSAPHKQTLPQDFPSAVVKHEKTPAPPSPPIQQEEAALSTPPTSTDSSAAKLEKTRLKNFPRNPSNWEKILRLPEARDLVKKLDLKNMRWAESNARSNKASVTRCAYQQFITRRASEWDDGPESACSRCRIARRPCLVVVEVDGKIEILLKEPRPRSPCIDKEAENTQLQAIDNKDEKSDPENEIVEKPRSTNLNRKRARSTATINSGFEPPSLPHRPAARKRTRKSDSSSSSTTNAETAGPASKHLTTPSTNTSFSINGGGGGGVDSANSEDSTSTTATRFNQPPGERVPAFLESIPDKPEVYQLIEQMKKKSEKWAEKNAVMNLNNVQRSGSGQGKEKTIKQCVYQQMVAKKGESVWDQGNDYACRKCRSLKKPCLSAHYEFELGLEDSKVQVGKRSGISNGKIRVLARFPRD